VTGLPKGTDVEGVDLHHLAKGDGPHPRSSPIAFAELGPEIYALETAGWKYIHNPKGYSSPGTAEHGSGYFGFFQIAEEELFDLEADPGEHHNVALQRPKIAADRRGGEAPSRDVGGEPRGARGARLSRAAQLTGVSRVARALCPLRTARRPLTNTGIVNAWYISAIDFRTGKLAWRKYVGSGKQWDNAMLTLSIGPDGLLTSGMHTGVLGLRDAKKP